MDNKILASINKLQQQTRKFEPSKSKRKKLIIKTLKYSNQFIKDVDKMYPITNEEDIDYQLSDQFDKKSDFKKLINFLKNNLDKTGLNNTAGGYLAYVPGGSLFHSALADFISDISNRYTGIYSSSPYGNEIENSLIRWLLKIVGFDINRGSGNLTSGGSIANLIAIITARDARLEQENYKNAIVYTTSQTHHCIQKALRIGGFVANEPGFEGNIRYIDLDENYRMDINSLKEAIKTDREKGKKPWLLVASAGTTNLGTIDPLKELAKIAKDENLWYHIDGSYGGFFQLTKHGLDKLIGIEKADSVAMDAHKSLFLPLGLGSVIVKDKELLFNSFHYLSAYINEEGDNEKYSPANLSPELSKPFRGLRLWIPLKVFGTKMFGKALKEKILLARFLFQKLKEIKDIELINEPDLSIFAFRFKPVEISDNKLLNDYNHLLIKQINRKGTIHLSGTTIPTNSKDGITEEIFIIRIAILNFRTHLKHVQMASDTISLCIQQIRKEVLQ